MPLALLFMCLLAPTGELTISGKTFLLDGRPFPYTGISFFNAIYNPAFSRGADQRTMSLEKFRRYGINVLRVWAQWDSKRGYADTCPECTLYFPDGRLRADRVETLKQIAADARRAGMVIELVLFSQESWHDNIRLGREEADKAAAAITREMLPFRNVTFQVWNEFAERVPEHVRTIKSIDSKRLVTNSPGVAGVLGGFADLAPLDYLTPHTTRSPRHWEVAPREIEYLLARYGKPVVDDEPARNGTPKFGGPKNPTQPADHILQIMDVWRAGGYITYHHDMFQLGYGAPSTPPNGIPDPEFNPYHRAVLEFIALRDRYAPALNRISRE